MRARPLAWGQETYGKLLHHGWTSDVGRFPPFGASRPELPKVGDVHYSTILIFNPDFASTPILLVLIHFADLLRRIAMNGIARLTVGISRFYEPTHMHVLRLDTLS